MSLEGGREGREGRGGEGRRGEGRGGMTVIHILMEPQYLNNNHVGHVLRNNASRHSIGSTPNNGSQLLRSM